MDAENEENIIFWGLATIIADIVFQYKVFEHYDYFKDKTLNKFMKSFWKHMIAILYFSTLPFYH